MARPLRRNVRDGWYHVFHRGTERGRIFGDVRDREHFLELLARFVEQYGVRVHAYALMDTHYHMLVQTPEANLSQALQWLHLSHATWFNARHQRLGPFWQGRFRAVPVEAGAWVYTLSLYLHLNPVATEWFGLGKAAKQAEALGWAAPNQAEATRRLKQVRMYPWSSYRAYAGLAPVPPWLSTDEVLARAHRDVARRRAKYRRDVQQRLTHGADADVLERLASAVGIGGERFVASLKRAGGVQRETSGKREWRRRLTMGEVLRGVEAVRGEPWRVCGRRHGDWAQPLAMWAARRYTGLTLAAIGQAMGGKDYAAVSMALKRFDARAQTDAALRGARESLQKMLIVET